MIRPRFGLDLDGVCYKWSSTAALLIEHYWCIEVGESLTWTHIQDRVPPHVWKWLWRDGVEKHGLFRHGNCFPYTFESVDALVAQGWDIVVITSRPSNALADTLAWLSYHRIPAREVHILGEGGRKSAVPCDLYVDDSVGNIRDLAASGLRSLLWTRKWNEDVDMSGYAPLVSRVQSWREVLDVSGPLAVQLKARNILAQVKQ